MSEKNRPSSWARLFLHDPKQVLSVVQAALGLGATFGLAITGEQMGAIMTFLSALMLWLNSQQLSPEEIRELTKAAEGAVRAKNMEIDTMRQSVNNGKA